MNAPITESEVIKAIKQLKHGESSGPNSLIKDFLSTHVTVCDI